MEFKQLEAFVSVVETKSFSKAANKLYLTQPTVSAHIQSLEKELETRLILRNTKALTLSTGGQKLYTYAKDILTLRDSALQEFGRGEESLTGIITVAASTIPSQYILPKVMAQFSKIYPNVTFNIIKCDSGMVIKYLEEKRAEIGITGTKTDGSNCIFEAFSEDNLVVIAPNDEKYSKITNFDKALLLKSPFITREEQSGTRKEYEHYLSSMGISPSELNVVAQMDSIDSIKNSVASGLGISIMSYIAVEEYCKLGLTKCFTLNNTSIKRNLYIAKLKNEYISPIAERFIAKIRQFPSCQHCKL